MIATTTRTTTLCNALEDYDYGKKPKQTKVIRENNLDHWDSDTLAYYLDEYPGYDLAVMFYAPWDDYSNQLAPYWNQIAHILDAGTTQSKLIMVRIVLRYKKYRTNERIVPLFFCENCVRLTYGVPKLNINDFMFTL